MFNIMENSDLKLYQLRVTSKKIGCDYSLIKLNDFFKFVYYACLTSLAMSVIGTSDESDIYILCN